MPQALWSLAVIQVVTALSISISLPFWVVYAVKVVGLTEYEWGLVMLMVGIVGFTLSIPMGHLVDRYGSRRMFLIAIFVAPIAVFLFPFCKTPVTILTIQIILAIVDAIILSAFSTITADIIPRNRRGRLLSLLGQGVAIRKGARGSGGGLLLFIPVAVGSLLGGYVYEVNPRFPWFILTGVLILCLILSIRFIREPEKAEV